MKINDVEKLLGITKANIRFYEKEGLIKPGRSENGYREYSEVDVVQLKEIIILRKLGIPVQQIADILDGVLPLQDALDSNITALQAEIEKLNGSLALCKQLKAEDARMLDTERYWKIIHDQEQLGFQFQSLVYDYLDFMKPILEWVFWYIPEGEWNSLWNIGKCILFFTILNGALGILAGDNFFLAFWDEILAAGRTILIWAALLLIPYLIHKKNPEKGKRLRTIVAIITAVSCIILFLATLTYIVAFAA